MPRSGQIVPEHWYPHTNFYINDNTGYSNPPSSDSGNTNMILVFASPKGKDRVLTTIDDGMAGFINEYGVGTFAEYGQPYMNAYTAFATGKIKGHCLRITADDAKYANVHIFARYKATAGEDETDGKVDVQFVAVSSANITTLSESVYEAAVTAAMTALPEKAGFTDVHMYSLFMRGRGSYGDTFRHRVSSLTQLDKQNNFKNYLFEIYEDTTQKESFNVIFAEDALIDEVNYSTDIILNDPDSGSAYIEFYSDYSGFRAIVDAYKGTLEDPTKFALTYDTFDVLLGVDKTTKTPIPNYVIDSVTDGSVVVNQLAGINLDAGSDGAFAKVTDSSDSAAVTARNEAINKAYKDVFDGITDPNIKSKNKFPTHLILDANYPTNIKTSIAALASARRDCFCILDCGASFTSKAGALDYLNTNLDAITQERVFFVAPWYAKVKDPVNGKVVTVSSTYFFAFMYPLHFDTYGGKHIPLAGANFGKLSGFIKGTVFPVMDEDLDSTSMDAWVDARANYVQVSSKGDVYIGTQTTRQSGLSALSEGNNVMVLLDIVRDCVNLVDTYPYNFMEASDLNRYNGEINTILSKYPGAQVRSLTATFNSNDWEKTRGILHLYATIVNKDIIKIGTVEIDVNR